LGGEESLGNALAIQLATNMKQPVHASVNLPYLNELDVDLY